MKLLEMSGRPKDKFVMLCKDLKNLSRKEKDSMVFPTWLSKKYDGIFCIAHKVDKNTVQIGSRTGELYTSMGHLEEILNTAMGVGTVLIFEAMIYKADGPGFETLNIISGACRDHKNQHPELVAFIHDWLLFDEFIGTIASAPFAMRYARVSFLNNAHTSLRVIEQKHCPDIEVAKGMCKQILSEGGEGVVLTAPMGHYKGGYRGIDMVKLKGTLTFDLRVLEVVEGKGKYAGTTGTLRLEWFNGRTVDVSGMTDEQRESWWVRPWNIIGQIVEVEAMNKSPLGILTQPRFKRVREDKLKSDVEENLEEGRVNCYGI